MNYFSRFKNYLSAIFNLSKDNTDLDRSLIDIFTITIISILLFISFIFPLKAESTTTNLTDKQHIEEFVKATSQIRCICLPSLPIKSCSFNNCEISALLKEFIENRIKQGETADTIVYKMQNGFGEDVFEDPIIQRFMQSGNKSIVNGVVYGFGEKILAEPDSTSINLTLALIIISGIGLIYLYARKVRKNSPVESSETTSLDKYLKELD
ncbi:MAG: cytochrome c-type biogenesis protein CcmH [Leptospiraceae bacterium]|nr:cytochrome c-type biogenesis protein CcmH [Leptospiraceae bacterium]